MKNNKKILFISHEASLTGAPVSLLNLIRRLGELDLFEIKILLRSEGFLEKEFHKLAPTEVYYKKVPKKTVKDIILYNLNRGRHRKNIEQKLFREWQPDLVYSNTVANGELIEIAGKYCIPVVVHVRELHDTIRSIGQKNLQNFILIPKRYIVVSNAVRESLNKNFSISLEKITQVNNFIDADKVIQLSKRIPPERIRQQLKIPADAIVIGGAGKISPRKGVDYFVKVASKCVKDGLKTEMFFLWVGGPVPGETEDGERIKPALDNELKNKIIFTGIQENPHPYYNIFDIFLMTSREDPFPLVNLEVSALKKPIICFRGSGGSEEFVNNDCGFIIDNFDTNEMASKVEELLDSPELRKKTGEKAYLKTKEIYNGKTSVLESARIILESARVQGAK